MKDLINLQDKTEENLQSTVNRIQTPSNSNDDKAIILFIPYDESVIKAITKVIHKTFYFRINTIEKTFQNIIKSIKKYMNK